jgi:hypothetical protein
MYLRGRLAGLWPSRPRTMRFPYIRSEPATKAKRQRSVFASLASLIASWIYYTLLHPYTVVECITYPSQPDLTAIQNKQLVYFYLARLRIYVKVL